MGTPIFPRIYIKFSSLQTKQILPNQANKLGIKTSVSFEFSMEGWHNKIGIEFARKHNNNLVSLKSMD